MPLTAVQSPLLIFLLSVPFSDRCFTARFFFPVILKNLNVQCGNYVILLTFQVYLWAELVKIKCNNMENSL